MNIPRPEHPNPQWEREGYRNLNGEWEFDFDFSKSARERELFKKGALSKRITVPFCPESSLSGIGYTDFIPSVCYRKVITLTNDEIGGNVFLNFGAADFHSFIYVNGIEAGRHIGGFSSFKVDITKYVKTGENEIFVICEDDVRGGKQPAGKQSTRLNSYGCFYTRTTGIWQTVWLEFTPRAYIKSAKYYPDIDNSSLTVAGETVGVGEIELSASYEGRKVGEKKVKTTGGSFTAEIALSELHLWEIGNGRLYDLTLKFGKDTVKSYFGMRKVSLDGYKFMLNNRPLFLRTVLDQGFYPDGIYTARDDETLKKDILLAKEMGFHGARLHQKVFEKRFLYHADKEGYIVFGEHGNWGMDYLDSTAQGNFIAEWTEILERDFNSPSVIGWCPFNETWDYEERKLSSRLIESVYKITKIYDKTRICIDTSGNYHIDQREIYDIHDYEQDTDKFREYYAHIGEGIVNDQVERMNKGSQPYHLGEPVFMSEYGGIKWAPDDKDGWGYGNAPKTLDEYIERYETLSSILLQNPYIMGLCYTQLYDVEQEQNGLYYYDRTPKFDEETIKKLRSAITKKAKIEE